MRQVGYNRGGESSATVVILILFLAANEKHHPRVDRYSSCLCYSKVSRASTKSVKRTAGLKHTPTTLFWGRKENAGVDVSNDPCTTGFFNSDANKLTQSHCPRFISKSCTIVCQLYYPRIVCHLCRPFKSRLVERLKKQWRVLYFSPVKTIAIRKSQLSFNAPAAYRANYIDDRSAVTRLVTVS